MKCKKESEKKYDHHQSFLVDKDRKNFVGIGKWKNDEEETLKALGENAKGEVRVYEKDLFGQLLVKYRKRIFWVERCEEDLILCWLSLLEYQVELPLRFFMEENPSQKKRSGKDLWVEIKFLLPSGTTNESIAIEQDLENKFCRFFTEGLIPAIEKFKSERINWECMMLEEYDDGEVGEEIDNELIKKINHSFRVYCQ